MSIFKCDFRENCWFKPKYEIFFPSTEEEDGKWMYICFWHMLKMRIKRLLGKEDFSWCKVDTNRQSIEEIRFEIWDLKNSVDEIKDKLGIECECPECKKKVEEEDKNKGYE